MGLTAPPSETAWILHNILGFEAMAEDETGVILEEMAKFAEGVLAPLDGPGDKAGAQLENGGVRMPDGFAEAFRSYAESGWIGISAGEQHGGQGLPELLALAAFEAVSSANMAFGLCPMLTQYAIAALEKFGTPDQQQRLLPPMIDGRWTGTMCLTEPQAGSDLSDLRTRAIPDGDHAFRVSGQKIFITYGDHGMTENILHMVLARLPDAPPGSAGISLFAVPRNLPDGSRNGVTCISIEHKLGIHASPTCTMLFENAKAELIGPPHRGLPCMFAMMNAARLGVAIQGVASAERAFRRAVDFAGERKQFGAAIVGFPDVRRMLWTMRALAVGGRLLSLYTARMAEDDGNAERAALLVPVAKAWCSDAGVEAASLGIQVHGGMGYVEETGAAQHLRDARISPIYEGANGIQALTVLRRGLLRDQGAAVGALIEEIEAADYATPPLLAAAHAVADAAAWLRKADARQAEAGATAFLQLLGTVTAGWLCARVVARADAPPTLDSAAQVYLSQILPRASSLAAALMAPATALTDMAPVA